MVDCGTEGGVLISERFTPTIPNYPTNRMCCGIPEWPLPFWLKATALNSSEHPVTIVSLVISSCMHTAEEQEEPEPPIILRDLPLKTWTIWIRWCSRRRAFGVIGAYLKKHTHTHVVGIRIARL